MKLDTGNYPNLIVGFGRFNGNKPYHQCVFPYIKTQFIRVQSLFATRGRSDASCLIGQTRVNGFDRKNLGWDDCQNLLRNDIRIEPFPLHRWTGLLAWAEHCHSIYSAYLALLYVRPFSLRSSDRNCPIY